MTWSADSKAMPADCWTNISLTGIAKRIRLMELLEDQNLGVSSAETLQIIILATRGKMARGGANAFN